LPSRTARPKPSAAEMVFPVPEPRNGTSKQADAAPQVSSPDHIVSKIVRGLYEGRYVPGQRLIEADLTREYRVSRGSVREALKRLAAEGIATLSLHRGAYIRALTRHEVREVLAVVEVLTGLAARLAAERIGLSGHRALLEERLAEVLSFEDRNDMVLFVRARNRFYRAVAQIGANHELSRMLPSMHVHLIRVQFRRYGNQAEAHRFDDYRQICAAIVGEDARRAELAMRRHIRRISDGIQHMPDQAFAPDP
jgi:DNA-binding GntR family transcriptional regulator